MCHLLCVDINLIIAISTCHWDRWQSPQWQRPDFELISPSAHTPCHPWKSIWAKARTIFCPHRDSKVSEVKRLVRSLLNETGNPLKGSLKEWQQEFYNWNTIFTGPRCLWGPVYGSRCLYLCHSLQDFVKLCWCDSGCWWYQLNTSCWC